MERVYIFEKWLSRNMNQVDKDKNIQGKNYGDKDYAIKDLPE